MPVELLRRKFTVEHYHQMAQAGILTEDDRVELIRPEPFLQFSFFVVSTWTRLNVRWALPMILLVRGLQAWRKAMPTLQVGYVYLCLST
jgi:hypothetical protein